MALTPGTVTVGTITESSVQLSSTAFSGGTGPYTYQWHRSTTSGFSPSVGNAIAGATSLAFVDTGLIPGTQYYYKLVGTDSATSPDEGVSTQASALTLAPTQNPNQFAQAPYIGMVDQAFNFNTHPVMVDSTQSVALTAGQAVKAVDSAGGVPKVVAASADTDAIIGFVNYNFKNPAFAAMTPVEISMDGNVIWLYATGAIARFGKVVLDVTTKGGVKAATGSTGDRLVGIAYDKSIGAGQLIRVYVQCLGSALDS